MGMVLGTGYRKTCPVLQRLSFAWQVLVPGLEEGTEVHFEEQQHRSMLVDKHLGRVMEVELRRHIVVGMDLGDCKEHCKVLVVAHIQLELHSLGKVRDMESDIGKVGLVHWVELNNMTGSS